MKRKVTLEDISAANVVLSAGPLQSLIRQFAFGASHFLDPEQRTHEVEQQLAVLHEDEARYHAQEAAWIRRPNAIHIRSIPGSTGGRKTTATRGQ